MKDELYSTDYDLRVGEIITAHEYVFSPGGMWSAYGVRRGFCGLVMALEGEAIFHVGATTLEISEGQIAYFPADCGYVMEVAQNGRSFRHFTVNFTISEVSGVDIVRSLLTGTAPHVTGVSEHTTLESTFPQLVSAWHDKAPGYRVKTRELLYGMLHDFVSRYVAQQINPDLLAHVMPAKKMIDEHYNEDLTISAMADLCGLSETHFRRCFFSAFGMSPIAYRTKLRIERAKDLLLGSWYPIGEIATMTGFSDISFFSRFFTRHTGLSPSTFRKEYGSIDAKED